FVQQHRIADGGLVDRRCYRTWADTDHKDAIRSQFDARRAREHTHPALGQAVGRVAWHWPVLVYRGDIDDASTTLLDHLPCSELGAKERTLEIDSEYFFVLRLARVEYRGACFDTGIVDHDIDASERFDSS